MGSENTMLSEIGQTESQEPCDFTHMWDIKLKARNEQTRQTSSNSQTDNNLAVTEGSRAGVRGIRRAEGSNAC